VRDASNGEQKARRTKELIDNYVKPLFVARLRDECNDLLISTKDGNNKNKDRRTLAFDLVTELVKRVANGSITSAHLMSGNRMTVEGSLSQLADAALVGDWGVTAPQLMAIISGRLKMIGRECTTLLNTYPQLITGMSTEFEVVEGAITDRLAGVDAELITCGVEISKLKEKLEEETVGCHVDKGAFFKSEQQQQQHGDKGAFF
jgi:hypothetical protein